MFFRALKGEGGQYILLKILECINVKMKNIFFCHTTAIIITVGGFIYNFLSYAREFVCVY